MPEIRRSKHSPTGNSIKSSFITGTLLLTLAGVLTRIIGFFYRIFLSRTIGAEGLGIYQLLSPVTALGFAVTSAGIQTSISRFVSTETGRKNETGARLYLAIGLFLSLMLSAATGIFIQRNAAYIAASCLGDTRLTPLLSVLALSFVPSCIHACINGYYYGIKKAGVPSLCQLTEQLARVGSVYVIHQVCISEGKSFTISMAVWGLVIGEAASTLVSVTFFSLTPQAHSRSGRTHHDSPSRSATGRHRNSGDKHGILAEQPNPSFDRDAQLSRLFLPYTKNLLAMAVPLTANRIVLNLFSSFEHIMIPSRLKMFGYTNTEALSVYGILTGMAMAIIMFPSVVTNSVSVLLLPTISEAQASGDKRLIRRTIRRTLESCLFLGFLCTAGFLVTGDYIGNTLFGNALAGTFITTLGWICPFLYLSSTLSSILHGLGFPGITFGLNLASCAVRILFVLYAVPVLGIKSYLWGILVSQAVIALLAVAILYRKESYAK